MVWIIISCSPKTASLETPIDYSEDFSNTGNQEIPDEWWTTFEDEQLNSLIDSALSDNLSIASIWEQFQAEKENVRIQGSNQWPQVEASLRSGISRPQPDFAGGENTQAGLSASYEVDLWGRIKATKNAATFRATASYYDYQTATMSLSAEVSIAYFNVLSALQQIDLIKEQININERITKLIKARFSSGQLRAVDVLRQQQLLESTKALQIRAEQDLELAQNQLALLVGKPAQSNLLIKKRSLPKVDSLPATGLPLELTRRRPDLKSAYQRVLAADRDFAAAISNKYPRLSFTVATQARSNTYANLFQDWAYSISGNLVAPIFYGGRLKAEANQAESLKQSALYDYGQTVLIAFREVEDALINELKQKERMEVLERQLSLSDKTNRQIRLEFLNGFSEYLDLLIALNEQQQLRREQITAQQELLEFRVSLYRALAGSFKTIRENEINE
ncbi:efflux transporter outer membrane subunit [Nonlabens agnitus]|uniref:RND transporter n=1 Tax=Nonlabens agnitus TaxID=870484 RepID=A0A2S9WS79_9FLAO|nr:efflux transporter outer membrane subunit [Nonlabens agnitus]PRP66331.1 hypothetical protein BST86_04120 [Nonlabens agnitus]